MILIDILWLAATAWRLLSEPNGGVGTMKMKEREAKFRAFFVVDRGNTPKFFPDGKLYASYRGAPYQEQSLREWANDRWGTPLDAPLDVIARDISQGGWLLYEGIWPAEGL